MKGLAIVLLLASANAFAAPHYDDIVLSDRKDGKPTKVFKRDTAKFFVTAKLVDVPPGTSLKGDWIAEKTNEAPPNYRILTKEIKSQKNWIGVDFSLSKPKNGWPVGSYRVDLFIDGKPAGSVAFSVEK